MKQILKTIIRFFIKIINHIVFSVYFKILSKNKNFDELEDFSKKKILVLAPHIDDDIIGCGGTIYNYILNDSKVKILYLTDGSQSNSNFRSNKDLIRKRKQEAKKAANLLGVNDIQFLNYPDKQLRDHRLEFINDVKRIVGEYNPDVLFAPFIIDVHPDHRILAKALPEIIKDNNIINCYLYNGEFPMSHYFINVVCNVNKEIKKEAYQYYTSQMINFNNLLDFSFYRSYLLNKKSNCLEVFYKYSEKEYIKLLKVINSYSNFTKDLKELRSLNNSYKTIASYFKKMKIEKKIKDKL